METLKFNYGAEGYDSVRCNNCMRGVGVRPDSDTCPACGFEGGLMDPPHGPLKYNYGETPEEVIGDRWREFVRTYEPGSTGNSYVRNWVVSFPDVDRLLTVLDALKVAAKVSFLRAPDNRFDIEVARADWSRRAEAKAQRVSILAALGIDES